MPNRKKGEQCPLIMRRFQLWKDGGSKIQIPSIYEGKSGQPLTDVKKPWALVLEDAFISDFKFHDLRHHFASKLVMAGVDLNTVRELLDHADLNMILRYAHLAPEHKAAAVGLIG